MLNIQKCNYNLWKFLSSNGYTIVIFLDCRYLCLTNKFFKL